MAEPLIHLIAHSLHGRARLLVKEMLTVTGDGKISTSARRVED
jgi:hypothetical protein